MKQVLASQSTDALQGGQKSSGFNISNQLKFENLLNGSGKNDGVPSGVQNIVKNVEASFEKKQHEIVKSIEKFEETGGALDLMIASHKGSNNSVMVQLCGTVSKKTADNTEQIYKQQ